MQVFFCDKSHIFVLYKLYRLVVLPINYDFGGGDISRFRRRLPPARPGQAATSLARSILSPVHVFEENPTNRTAPHACVHQPTNRKASHACTARERRSCKCMCTLRVKRDRSLKGMNAKNTNKITGLEHNLRF